MKRPAPVPHLVVDLVGRPRCGGWSHTGKEPVAIGHQRVSPSRLIHLQIRSCQPETELWHRTGGVDDPGAPHAFRLAVRGAKPPGGRTRQGSAAAGTCRHDLDRRQAGRSPAHSCQVPRRGGVSRYRGVRRGARHLDLERGRCIETAIVWRVDPGGRPRSLAASACAACAGTVSWSPGSGPTRNNARAPADTGGDPRPGAAPGRGEPDRGEPDFLAAELALQHGDLVSQREDLDVLVVITAQQHA